MSVEDKIIVGNLEGHGDMPQNTFPKLEDYKIISGVNFKGNDELVQKVSPTLAYFDSVMGKVSKYDQGESLGIIQEEIEKLNRLNCTKGDLENPMNYSVGKEFTKYIVKFDEACESVLDYTKLPYLFTNMKPRVNNDLTVNSTYKKLFLVLKIMKHLKESIGLLVFSVMVSCFRKAQMRTDTEDEEHIILLGKGEKIVSESVGDSLENNNLSEMEVDQDVTTLPECTIICEKEIKIITNIMSSISTNLEINISRLERNNSPKDLLLLNQLKLLGLKFSREEKHKLYFFILDGIVDSGLIAMGHGRVLKPGGKRTTPAVLFPANDEARKIILSVKFACATPLPMLCTPREWDEYGHPIGDQTSYLRSGGYLTSEAIGIHNKSEVTRVLIKSYHVENINFVQQNGYKIDTNRLLDIASNFDKHLADFLDNALTTEISKHVYFNNNLGDGTYTFFSKNEFFDSYMRRLGKQKFSKFDKYEAHRVYNKLTTCIHDFIYIIIISLIFEPFTIYFTWFYDSVLRMYALGHLLTPQGSELVKSLLFLDTHNPIEFVSGDVTSSGSQIAGGLVGCERALTLTNLFSERIGNNDYSLNTVKKDLYQEVREKFMDQLDLSAFENCSGRDLSIFKELFDRKFIKKFVMCEFYSEGNFARTKKLVSACNEAGIFSSIKNKELFFPCKNIVNQYEFVIRSLFPDIFIYMDFVQNLVKRLNKREKTNSILKISAGNGRSLTLINKPRFVKLKISGRVGRVRVPVRRNFQYETKKLDIAKATRSVLPHIAHNIDAELLQYVLTQIRLVNEGAMYGDVRVIPSHDCFVAHKGDLNMIGEWYCEAFTDIVLDRDILTHFMTINSLIPTDKDIEYIKSVNSKKLDIRWKRFVGGNYINSRFILT
jgi:hypothetical protein